MGIGLTHCRETENEQISFKSQMCKADLASVEMQLGSDGIPRQMPEMVHPHRLLFCYYCLFNLECSLFVQLPKIPLVFPGLVKMLILPETFDRGNNDNVIDYIFS